MRGPDLLGFSGLAEKNSRGKEKRKGGRKDRREEGRKKKQTKKKRKQKTFNTKVGACRVQSDRRFEFHFWSQVAQSQAFHPALTGPSAP